MFGSRPRRTTCYAYSESMAPDLQYGWSALHSLRSPRYKFIQAPRPELYDLAADPGEATNVFAQHRQLAVDMARELERLIAETSRDAPGARGGQPRQGNGRTPRRRSDTSADVGSRPSDARRVEPLADPKDKLEVFTAVQRAGELMVNDEYAQAAQALESARRAGAGDAAGAADAGIVLHGAGTDEGRQGPDSTTCSRTIRRACRG